MKDQVFIVTGRGTIIVGMRASRFRDDPRKDVRDTIDREALREMNNDQRGYCV